MKINDLDTLDTWPRIPPMDGEMYAIGLHHTIVVGPDGDRWQCSIIMSGGPKSERRLKWSQVGEWCEEAIGVDFTKVSEFAPFDSGPSFFKANNRDSSRIQTSPAKSRHVYFIQCGKTGPIKIGFANDVSSRLASLQTASPFDLRLLTTIKGPASLERQLHKRFAGDRLRGEWFLPTAELLAFVEEVAA